MARICRCYKVLLIPALLLSTVSGQEVRVDDSASTTLLPGTLGEYRLVSRTSVPLKRRDSQLLVEYGLQATEGCNYRNPVGRKMRVEVYRFATSEGGHAAYLSLRPDVAVDSPVGEFDEARKTFGETHAVVGRGVTVVGRNNYVFRFHDSAPTSGEMRNLLNLVPEFDSRSPRRGECCGYFVQGSERILLGPIGLARFAPRVPLSAVGFGPGVQGRIARFETPAGTMTRIVFEYPTPTAAVERVSGFTALPGALVQVADNRIGIVFDPASKEEADAILSDIAPEKTQVARGQFDLRSMDGDLTLDDAMSSTFFASFLGCLLAVVRAFVQRREGIPDRTISLGIARG